MRDKEVRKCDFCGSPYMFNSSDDDCDSSACPKCVYEAKQNSAWKPRKVKAR
jgi:hypothetical protein